MYHIFFWYNPCNVVCVFYNCTISFEGLSYPIHILIITRWYLCRLCYLCRKMSLRLSVSISHENTIVIFCTYLSYFVFSWSVGFPGWSARRNRRRSPGSRVSGTVESVGCRAREDRTLRACWQCMAGVCVSEAQPCAPVPANQASWVDWRVHARRTGVPWQERPEEVECIRAQWHPESARGVRQKRLLVTNIRMPWMGVRVVQRHNVRQMLSLQDSRALLSQHEPSGMLTQFITFIY